MSQVAHKTPLRQTLNRKTALYVVSAIGVVILLAMLILFAGSNPKATREKAEHAAAVKAAQALPSGTEQQASTAINRQMQQIQRRVAKQVQPTPATKPAPVIAAQPPASTPKNLPPLDTATLSQLADAYKNAQKPSSPIVHGGLSLVGSGDGQSDGVFQAYPGMRDYHKNAAADTGQTADQHTSQAKAATTYAAIHPLNAPASRILTQGTLIRAVLLSAIDTRSPGHAEATVTQNVYDSLGNGQVLVPKGSRLIGAYQTAVSPGLPRIPVNFKRLILPDGRAINLEGMPAVNYAGDAGVPGKYHSNILRALGPSLLVALIGTAVDRLNRGQQEQLQNRGGTVVQSPSVAEQMAPQVNQAVISRYGSAKPYFIVKAGTPFKVFTTRDIVIPVPPSHHNSVVAGNVTMPGSASWQAGEP